ncbi:hypothetical protein [Streptomyces sp. NPDC058279]|uniref:hypothetical protein n=1 Tax=Streptomyces sp. NPDC058279 TaxID=3346418 RepID=UPI0036E3913A
MNPQTHLAVDGYVDAIPAPGDASGGTAVFDLIVSPGNDADPDTPDLVFACTTADPALTNALLTEIQPGDLLHVSGTVAQPDDRDAPRQLTVNALEVLDAAPGPLLHMVLERYGIYVVVFDADREQVPVFTAFGTWVGEAASPDEIGALIGAFENGGEPR